MYVVISGVHGVGRSTIARAVAWELGGEFFGFYGALGDAPFRYHRSA